MKLLKRWLPPLFTLLLVIAGAAMPWAAAQLQDRYGVSSREVLPFDPVSLTLRKESEIGAILRLMGNLYDVAGWQGETRLTEEEANQTAFDVLAQLDRHGLLEPCFDLNGDIQTDILDRMKAEQDCEATPMLFIATDGSSAVIWSCSWTDPAGVQYLLQLDDATGLAVSGYIPCSPAEDGETLYQRMERWRSFFEDYYNIVIQNVQDTFFDASSQFLYLFDPEDGLGQWGLSVYMYDCEMSFGSYIPEELGDIPSLAEAYGWETEQNTAFFSISAF